MHDLRLNALLVTLLELTLEYNADMLVNILNLLEKIYIYIYIHRII